MLLPRRSDGEIWQLTFNFDDLKIDVSCKPFQSFAKFSFGLVVKFNFFRSLEINQAGHLDQTNQLRRGLELLRGCGGFGL